MKITYKIVVDPTSLDYLVSEIILASPTDPITKRILDNTEFEDWTRTDFVKKLTEAGYAASIETFIKQNKIKFADD